MKKILQLVFLSIIGFIYAQKVPVLPLKEKAISHYDNDFGGLDKNDLAIILGSFSSWSPTIYQTVYIFKNNGDIEAYTKDESTKKLNLSSKNQKHLFEVIHSKAFREFLQYNQNDFLIKNKTEQPPCMIHDSATQTLIVVQNGKENSYSYYSPQYFLEDCNHPGINKTVLKKYVDLLEMFRKAKNPNE